MQMVSVDLAKLINQTWRGYCYLLIDLYHSVTRVAFYWVLCTFAIYSKMVSLLFEFHKVLFFLFDSGWLIAVNATCQEGIDILECSNKSP